MKKFLMGSFILVIVMPAMATTDYLNYLAKRDTDNSGWQWAKMATLPITKWETKKPTQNVVGSYAIFGNIDKIRRISIVGTKNTPLYVNFHAAIKAEGNKKHLWTVKDLVNSKDLTLIQTNCTEPLKPWSGEETVFYKWVKAGYRPLFIKSETVVNHEGDIITEIDMSLSQKEICSQ